MNKYLLLSIIPIAIGVGAWWLIGDLAIAVSMMVCTVYIVLLSVKVPLEDWIHLNKVRTQVEERRNERHVLYDPCPKKCRSDKRHTHVGELLDIVPAEKTIFGYGAAKLAGKLLIDIRHSWEQGIGAALILLVIWGVLSFAKVQGPGPIVQPPNIGVAGDIWKASLTALVGFFKLGTSAEFLHWFRKQLAQID